MSSKRVSKLLSLTESQQSKVVEEDLAGRATYARNKYVVTALVIPKTAHTWDKHCEHTFLSGKTVAEMQKQVKKVTRLSFAKPKRNRQQILLRILANVLVALLLRNQQTAHVLSHFGHRNRQKHLAN